MSWPVVSFTNLTAQIAQRDVAGLPCGRRWRSGVVLAKKSLEESSLAITAEE